MTEAIIPNSGFATPNPDDMKPRLMKGKGKKKIKATKKIVKKAYNEPTY